jgi:hypothetical protein
MYIKLEQKGVIFHEQLIVVLLPLFILCELLTRIFDKFETFIKYERFFLSSEIFV